MKNIIVAVHTGNQTIAKHNIMTTEDGQPVIIPAQGNVNYELIDLDRDVAPDHIIVKRQNNDLYITFDDNAESTDVIISDFYDYSDSTLSGLAESGDYYYYTPDTSEVADYVTQLVEVSGFSGHALGGGKFSQPWWTAEMTGAVADTIKTTTMTSADSSNMLPWLVGSVAVVGAAVATTNGSDGGNKNTNSESTDNANDSQITPSLVLNNIASDNIVNQNESEQLILVTGTTKNIEDGTQVTLTLGNKKYTGTVNNNSFDVEVDGPSLASHQQINAEISTKEGDIITASRSYQVEAAMPSSENKGEETKSEDVLVDANAAKDTEVAKEEPISFGDVLDRNSDTIQLAHTASEHGLREDSAVNDFIASANIPSESSYDSSNASNVNSAHNGVHSATLDMGIPIDNTSFAII